MAVRVDGFTPQPGSPSKPGQLRQEYAVDDVLALAAIPRDVIRARRTPVEPKLFPAQHGYRQTPLTIRDVLATDRWAPKGRQWLSGAPAMRLIEPGAPEGGAGLRNFNQVQGQ